MSARATWPSSFDLISRFPVLDLRNGRLRNDAAAEVEQVTEFLLGQVGLLAKEGDSSVRAAARPDLRSSSGFSISDFLVEFPSTSRLAWA